MKAEGSMLNTHIKTVKGLVTYEIDRKMHFDRTEVDIRVTSEKRESLSLTAKNVQILVDVKDIEEVIREARGCKA